MASHLLGEGKNCRDWLRGAHLAGRDKTLLDVGEAGLLRAFEERLSRRGEGVIVAVGDDAALLRTIGPAAVLSADLLIEQIDFEFAWASFADVGYKAAAANLSDLAGMGAKPRGLLLSLGLRGKDKARDVLSLVAALDRCGRRFGAPLVGGDLSEIRGPLVVAVTVVGEVTTRLALRRHRGRPGDVVMVSGALGGAAAGLRLLQAHLRAPKGLCMRQLRPTPRVQLGCALAQARLVRSAADISDGLARDAMHVAGDGCTIELRWADVPLQRGVDRVASSFGVSSAQLALAGGEDFELVLAVAPAKVAPARLLASRLGVPLTPVGTVIRGRTPRIVGLPRGDKLRGFEHFR